MATHILAALAVTGGRPLRSEDLAYSASTNAAVIRGLLSRLHEAGLTKSQMGNGGGALLAKSANTIRLLDIFRAVEAPELFALHRGIPCPECPVGAHIQDAMRPALNRAQAAFEAELAVTTLAEIGEGLVRLGQFEVPLVRS